MLKSFPFADHGTALKHGILSVCVLMADARTSNTLCYLPHTQSLRAHVNTTLLEDFQEAQEYVKVGANVAQSCLHHTRF